MMDPECAICYELQVAKDSLAKIVGHIEWACAGSGKQADFGLTKNHVNEKISEIRQMQKWHEYHHSTGESLMETNSKVNSGIIKPRRWRKA